MSTETKERPKIYLNSVHLKGFKSIKDLTTNFKKGLNILIGKNGAGKSNLIELINQGVNFNINIKTNYRYIKLEYLSTDNHSFLIEYEKDNYSKAKKNELLEDKPELLEKFTIDGELAFDNSNETTAKKEITFLNRKISIEKISRMQFLRLGYQAIIPVLVKYNLPENLTFIDTPGIVKIKTDSNYLFWDFPESLGFIETIFWKIEDFYDNKSNDRLNEINTEKILNHLVLDADIINNLKRFTIIEDVRFNNNVFLYKQENSDIIESITIDNIKLDFKINGNWLPWSQLSDGTKRLFYIVSEVTDARGLALIEEPELGIHPHQFNLLMDFLKEQSEDKQIIISTHSPKALDHLSPDELDHILIAYYDLEKGTQIRHLSDKEISKAQKYMKEVGFFSDYWMLSDLE